MNSKFIDVTTFEKNNKNIKIVETFGEQPWEITVILNRDDGFYYAKGPFSRWDSITYIKLVGIDNEEKLDNWVKKMKESNK